MIVTTVPSCSTKRSVDDLSGELLTAVEAVMTTAEVSSSISRRSPSGEPRRQHAQQRGDDGAVEPGLAQRKPLGQQVDQKQRQRTGQQHQRKDAPRRTAHRVAGFAHPRHEEEFGNVLDVVLRAGFGDAQVVADVVVAGSQPQRPFVIEDGLADAVLLEVGIGEVIDRVSRSLPRGKESLRRLRRPNGNCR